MTNKPALIQRLEVREKYSNTQKWGWATTIVTLLVVAAGIGIVLVLNALLAPGR